MIATDKILHALAGAAIGFTVALLAGWALALAFVLLAAAGTLTMNGDAGARRLGGILFSSITITEYKA